MEMKTSFSTYKDVYLQIGRYEADGSVAIEAWNNQEGPIARLTVCLCDGSLAEDEAYVDTNNCPFADQLLAQGIAIDTGLTKQSGFCTYPLWQFNEDFLKGANAKIYDLYSENFDEYMESVNPSDDEGQTFGM